MRARSQSQRALGLTPLSSAVKNSTQVKFICSAYAFSVSAVICAQLDIKIVV